MTLFNKKLNRVAEESNEVEILTVGQNIQYMSASVPAAEDLILRIGRGGATVLYRQDNDDKKWSASNPNYTPIDMTEISLLSITNTEKLKPEDTSYAFIVY